MRSGLIEYHAESLCAGTLTKPHDDFGQRNNFAYSRD